MSDRLTQDLIAATKDLHQVNALIGVIRFVVIGGGFLTLVSLAWGAETAIAFVAWTVLAGILYTFWLICTHDAVHHTLSGWAWFDELSSRLISWPMLWPFGVYSELHRLHHSWNGRNLRDPERVQWTTQEYEQAHPLLRWYVRHQWILDIFIASGIGMILKTLYKGVILRTAAPRLTWQLILDGGGMVLMQGCLIALVLATHRSLLQYLLFWLILERTIGIGIQMRDHLEHYGLWGNHGKHHITQLYTCRNLHVLPGTGWLVGGLHYHSVHHAFPGIPFDQLPEAFRRIQAVLQKHQMPLMTVDAGYLRTSWQLSQNPLLI